MRMRNLLFIGFVGCILITAPSCKKKKEDPRSSITGAKYNDKEYGGFEVPIDYAGQEIGPNLVPIEGGTFKMGQTEEDVMRENRNIARRITVNSFLMDRTEISNINYLEYLNWTYRMFAEKDIQLYKRALPDTLVWREELAYNEPLVENYLRHPSYMNYPVVGVSWEQARDFCKWRTNRVNEVILIDKQILQEQGNFEGQKSNKPFDTDAYLSQSEDAYKGELNEANAPKNAMDGSARHVKKSDGILLPAYRLPTEAEWEYAALALIGNHQNPQDERYTDTRIYPWDGKSSRHGMHGSDQGRIVANFKRGRGDYMGMAGRLNDNASYTGEVNSYLPNDFGLYNMAGNVNEWVEDVYRPTTASTLIDADQHDISPFRGHVFKEKKMNGVNPEVDQITGGIVYQDVADSTIVDRQNYQKADVRDYADGDEISAGLGSPIALTEDHPMYEYANNQKAKAGDLSTMNALITNTVRVYKGGSWADRLYYLTPGSRRFLEQTKSSRTVGFRCAMGVMGGPKGHKFKSKRKGRY